MAGFTGVRFPVLTAAALLCRSLCWFPVWLIACVMFPELRLPEITALLTACGTLSGIGIYHVRSRRGGMHPVCAAAAVLLCAGGGDCLYHLYGAVFPAAVLPLIVLISALTVSGKEPDVLFSPTRFGAFMTCTVIAAVFLSIASLPFDTVCTAAVTAVLSITFLFQRNQWMLHRMVNRRSSTERGIPTDIRRNNLRLILILLGILSLLFLCREPILYALGKLRDLLIDVLVLLLHGFRQLLAWLSSEPVADSSEDAEGSGNMPYTEGNNWLVNLLIIIPTAFVAVFIWKQFLGEWVETIRDAILAVIARLRTRKAGLHPANGAADGAFTDTESSVLPDKPKKRQRRQWRRQLRAWQKMPDQPQKFYAGYRLMLDAPAWTEKPSAADTAREICGKWHLQTPDIALDSPTDALESDRYALAGLPENALADLQRILTKIAQIR